MESKHSNPGYQLTQQTVGTNFVTAQPTSLSPPGQGLTGQSPPVQWMPPPSAIDGCPPGLEYLTQLDQILVHQPVELLEVATGFETENKYQVKNILGQLIFFAVEESDVFMRQYAGPHRGFTMHVLDNLNQEVIRVIRPFHGLSSGFCLCVGCCEGAAQTIAVEAPPGNLVGHVKKRCGNLEVHFDILDANHRPLMKVRGPGFFVQGIGFTNDIDFPIMTSDDSQQIGKISKQWSGLGKEMYTNADNFAITFPMDLDVKVKGTLLGALFLIDFMFFERGLRMARSRRF